MIYPFAADHLTMVSLSLSPPRRYSVNKTLNIDQKQSTLFDNKSISKKNICFQSLYQINQSISYDVLTLYDFLHHVNLVYHAMYGTISHNTWYTDLWHPPAPLECHILPPLPPQLVFDSRSAEHSLSSADCLIVNGFHAGICHTEYRVISLV